MPCNLELRPAGGGVASTHQAGITVASVRPIGEVHGTSRWGATTPAMPDLRLSLGGACGERGLTGVSVAKTWRCGEVSEGGTRLRLDDHECTCLMGGDQIDGKEYPIPVGLRLLWRAGSATVCRQRRIVPSLITLSSHTTTFLHDFSTVREKCGVDRFQRLVRRGAFPRIVSCLVHPPLFDQSCMCHPWNIARIRGSDAAMLRITNAAGLCHWGTAGCGAWPVRRGGTHEVACAD